jgi:hypothetical protein
MTEQSWREPFKKANEVKTQASKTEESQQAGKQARNGQTAIELTTFGRASHHQSIHLPIQIQLSPSSRNSHQLAIERMLRALPNG